MAELINAKCPNCGAILELPAKLDRAFCMHCGGKCNVSINNIMHPEFCKDGKCGRCGGKDTLLRDWGKNCDNCLGTKICFVCKGTGKCTICNGTGKFKCETCDGTGFKVYQGE